MKLLEKRVTLGEYEFKVVTDRELAIKSFEAYPETIEYILKNEASSGNDVEIMINAIKNKELKELLEMEDKLRDLVKYVLPIMLKKAGESLDAQEIIDYATENDVIDDFNIGIIDFLFLGFSQRELGKPKIKFSMI